MRMVILAGILLLSHGAASAEGILGIKAGTSLSQIREQLPNATFVDMKPAWAPRTQKFYQMQGSGLSGIIVIKADDIRPTLKEHMGMESIATNEDESYFVASGFRFVPDEPVPLETLTKKYGRPDKSGVDKNYNKYASWLEQGVSATLSSKQPEYAVMIEYVYTSGELQGTEN